MSGYSINCFYRSETVQLTTEMLRYQQFTKTRNDIEMPPYSHDRHYTFACGITVGEFTCVITVGERSVRVKRYKGNEAEDEGSEPMMR